MKSVRLNQCYRLLNHGPITLIASASDGCENVMTASWVMPIDSDPPKIVAALHKSKTTDLIEVSREFSVNIPTMAMVNETYAAGVNTGYECDKISLIGLKTKSCSIVSSSQIVGCVAVLECKVISDPFVKSKHNLYIAEVVSAMADENTFINGTYNFTKDCDRTIHHALNSSFYMTGDIVRATDFQYEVSDAKDAYGVV